MSFDIYPTLRYRDAHAAIDFLERAFGFERTAVHEDGGIVHHAELQLGNGGVMLGSAERATDDSDQLQWEPGGSIGLRDRRRPRRAVRARRGGGCRDRARPARRGLWGRAASPRGIPRGTSGASGPTGLSLSGVGPRQPRRLEVEPGRPSARARRRRAASVSGCAWSSRWIACASSTAAGPVGLQVDARDQPVAEQERQHVVAVHALGLRHVDLEPVARSRRAASPGRAPRAASRTAEQRRRAAPGAGSARAAQVSLVRPSPRPRPASARRPRPARRSARARRRRSGGSSRAGRARRRRRARAPRSAPARAGRPRRTGSARPAPRRAGRAPAGRRGARSCAGARRSPARSRTATRAPACRPTSPTRGRAPRALGRRARRPRPGPVGDLREHLARPARAARAGSAACRPRRRSCGSLHPPAQQRLGGDRDQRRLVPPVLEQPARRAGRPVEQPAS